MMDDRGWSDPDDDEDPLRDGVRGELSPGETLLWTERPALPRMRRIRAMPLIFVAALTALSGVSLAAMLGIMPQGPVDPWTLLTTFGLAPAIIGGLIALDLSRRAGSWLARRWSLARTVYALTDQRVIIGRYDAQDGGLDAFSLIPGMIADTTRFEYSDGTGDLYFEGLDTLVRGPIGFFGIRRVRSVDRLLRETLIDPFARW
ncbi:hypothetical protein [Paludisphaera mucosa]|uniref:DUF304 domain-containing protein n=1 Tax=Paludisphaera mucosa TaxID=3030827 RepID=A0ABT6F6H3_9BACT|nr:hypothetical protein [Paludisphaera mucosa]MDG3003170.1 hypothetical protein [Paludisphaera mucosa]